AVVAQVTGGPEAVAAPELPVGPQVEIGKMIIRDGIVHFLGRAGSVQGAGENIEIGATPRYHKGSPVPNQRRLHREAGGEQADTPGYAQRIEGAGTGVHVEHR